MRSFLTFAVFAGLGVLFLYQKHHQNTPMATAPKSEEKKPATIVVAKAPEPQLTPAPRGVASEHNWMKRALDRAADVRDQSRAQTKQSQDP